MVSQNVREDPDFEPWRGAALERGFQAVAAVPLGRGETVHGVLVVYADRPYAFDELERTNTLIEGLLALAKSGHSTETTDTTDLAATARHCWENVPTGDGTLRVEADRTVEADPNWFRQLLENLCRNAVEHGSTDDGSVTVTVDDLEGSFISRTTVPESWTPSERPSSRADIRRRKTGPAPGFESSSGSSTPTAGRSP